MDNPPNEPPTEEAIRARQAVSGHKVHRVLLFGLIGVLLAYLLLFAVAP
jgi:hypothetical protein